jgi:predicted hydrocarbon binding protein
MTRVSKLIARATDDMAKYQEQLMRDPTHARVSVAGVTHALVPTHVLAHDLPLELVEILGAELAPTVMYRLGRLIGAAHARAFFADRKIAIAESQYRVLTGPFHFAWAGYGDVELLIWKPQLDKEFLVLWESHNSFSAQEALNDGIRKRACDLQAGYAAGWCAEATCLPIEVIEIACRAEGVARCRFVIAHADCVSMWVSDPRLHRPTRQYRASHRACPPQLALSRG